MGSVEMTCHGLESGGGRGSSAVNNDGKDESIRFPKVTGGSCSCSTQSVATDCVVDIENGVDEVRISVGSMERECRICMLSLDHDEESGIAIELGCSCKDELGAAHQQCAETWFTSKGNNVCEICNSIAKNVVVIPNNIDESRQQISQVNTVSANAVSVPITGVITVSTNAVQVRITGVNSYSTNAVSVPVSSTSTSRALSRFDWVVEGVLTFIVTMFFLWLLYGGNN